MEPGSQIPIATPQEGTNPQGKVGPGARDLSCGVMAIQVVGPSVRLPRSTYSHSGTRPLAGGSCVSWQAVLHVISGTEDQEPGRGSICGAMLMGMRRGGPNVGG